MLNATAMEAKRTRFATSLSRFLVLLAIAGCMRIESTGSETTKPDAAPPRGTSLDGPIPCGHMQCSSGTLCTHWSTGVDAGVPGDHISCSVVPTSCVVRNCDDLIDRCPPCISQLCSSSSYGYGVSVIGRDLYCPGV